MALVGSGPLYDRAGAFLPLMTCSLRSHSTYFNGQRVQVGAMQSAPANQVLDMDALVSESGGRSQWPLEYSKAKARLSIVGVCHDQAHEHSTWYAVRILFCLWTHMIPRADLPCFNRGVNYVCDSSHSI